MIENIALYRNVSFDGSQDTYRCMPTIRGKDHSFKISKYSAQRLADLMQDVHVRADVHLYNTSTAIHYWTEHKSHQ